MAPKAPKEPSSDADTMKTEFIAKLSTAADAMRQFSNFADALARVVAKVPLDDPEVVEILQAIIDATPAPSKKRKLAETELSADDAGKKKKRERKPKDPNAPKAPPSAYILFQNEIRSAVREQHPDVQYKELMGIISKQWGALDQEQKQPYFDRVIAAKQTHEVDLAKYIAEHPVYVPPEPGAKKVRKVAAKRAAPAKVAKTPPKSAEIVPSSDDTSESDSDSGSELSSDEKAGGNSDASDDEDEEVKPKSPTPPPPPKRAKTAAKKK
jgi:hypothetical protein